MADFPTIIDLSPVPQRNQNIDDFSARADAFLGKLPTFGTQLEQWGAAADERAATIDTAKQVTETARDEAIAARDAAQLAGNIYPDTATGLASGDQYFSVISDQSNQLFTLYENVSNTAVALRVYQGGPLSDQVVDTSTGTQTVAGALDSRAVIFPTLSDLQASAGIAVGTIVRFAGRSTPGDGGGNIGEIVAAGTGTADGGHYIDLVGSGFQFKSFMEHEPVIYIEQFGATPSSASTALSNAVAFAQPWQVVDGLNDSYALNSAVSITKSCRLGFDNKSLDFTEGGLSFTGGHTVTTKTLTADALTGSSYINLNDVSDVSPGEIFIIQDTDDFSFSFHRSYYYKGEFVEVSALNIVGGGGNLLLKKPLRFSYATTDSITITKISPIEIQIGRVNITAETDVAYPLSFENCAHSIIKASAQGGASGAVNIFRCYELQNIGGDQDNRSANIGLNYGVAVINSQDIFLDRLDAFGLRHGVTSGGSTGVSNPTNIRIIVRNSTIGAVEASGADFHGNTIDSYYEDCTIFEGAAMGGRNVGLINCDTNGRSLAGSPVVYLSEFSGGEFRINGGSLIWNEGNEYAVLPTNADRVTGISQQYDLIYEDITLVNGFTQNTGNMFFQAFNRDSNVDWGIKVSGLRFHGVFTQTRLIEYGLTNPVAAKYVEVTDVEVLPSLTDFAAGAAGAVDLTTRVVKQPEQSRVVIGFNSGDYRKAFSTSYLTIGGYTPRIKETLLQADGAFMLGVQYTALGVSTASGFVTTGNSANTLTASQTIQLFLSIE